MKITKKMPIAMDWDLLKEAIRNGQLSAGDEIELDDGSKWRVLDVQARRVLIWKHSGPGEDVTFNESGSSIYDGSDIQKYLDGEFRKTVPQELIDMVDGGFFLLSKEEIEKYLPREIDRIVTDENGETLCWWTRSAYRGTATYVWPVTMSGTVGTTYAGIANRCAPGVYLSV